MPHKSLTQAAAALVLLSAAMHTAATDRTVNSTRSDWITPNSQTSLSFSCDSDQDDHLTGQATISRKSTLEEGDRILVTKLEDFHFAENALNDEEIRLVNEALQFKHFIGMTISCGREERTAKLTIVYFDATESSPYKELTSVISAMRP